MTTSEAEKPQRPRGRVRFSGEMTHEIIEFAQKFADAHWLRTADAVHVIRFVLWKNYIDPKFEKWRPKHVRLEE